MRLVAIIGAGVLATAASHAHAADCSVDEKPLLAQTYAQFDEDPQGGWRPLADEDGCVGAAADLIAKYREKRRLELAELAWHEGQLRAAAGETDRAIALFEVSRHGMHDEPYVDATIAFLRHDRPGLLAARARLAALPKPAEWAESSAKYERQTGKNLTWPLNLDVVDGFIACFDKPYSQAYADVCRPK